MKKIVWAALPIAIAAAVALAEPTGDDSEKLIAFYDFSDGQVGAAAGTVAVTSGDATLTGTAAVTGAGGVVPYYTNNAPPSVYLNASRSAVCHNPSALAFDYGNDTDTSISTPPGGKVDFASLGARLTGKAEPFTVEYFVRMDENFSYYSSQNQWKYLSKTSLYLGGDDDNGNNKCDDVGFKVITPAAASTVTGAATQFAFQKNDQTTVWKPGEFSDGRWHHIAVVYVPGGEEGAKTTAGKMKFYVDHSLVDTKDYDNKTSLHDAVLRIGTGRRGKIATEPFHGWITCLRVTADELGEEDFMVACDVKDAVTDVVFAWNFEEGAVGDTIVRAAGYPFSDCQSADNTTVYCLHKELLPQYADGYGSNRRVLYGSWKMPWRNSKSAYFRGYQSLASGTANRAYTGTEMNFPGSGLKSCNPESWTMEAFVKVEYERANALIFGKHAQTKVHQSPQAWPQICWMLTAETGGKLKIQWELQNQDNYQFSTVKSTTTASNLLTPLNWHHVALSYDKQSRTFRLYVDYMLVKETTIDGELYESQGGYYFSRTEQSSAFEGWMDEIRFSSVVRTPESFIRLAPDGMKLILR